MASSRPSKRKPGEKLLKKKLHIRSRLGLHARPAALFAQVANRFTSLIRVKKGRHEVDGKSILGLLTLAAARGSSIEVTIQGMDAEEALYALEQMVCRTEPPTVITVVRHRPTHGTTPHAPQA